MAVELSELERGVLEGARDGEHCWETADRIHVSEAWVRRRRQELVRRFGARTMAAAVIAAENAGLLDRARTTVTVPGWQRDTIGGHDG